MNGESVNQIKELAIRSMDLKEVNGNQYSPETLVRVFSDPRPVAILVKSLTGIIDFLEANIDELDMDSLILHVVDCATVRVITKIHGERNERHSVICADLDIVKTFPFGQFMDQETFIIKCRSMFVPTDDMDRILKYTSKIDASASIKTEDDGVTQIARIKKGASGVIAENEALPVIIKLRPYRTFPDVEQPESEFLFRMNASDDSITCALFESDGGNWRNTARKNIAGYFELLEVTIPIIS